MKKYLKTEDYETIVTGKFVYGMTISQLVGQIGCSDSTVSSVIAVFTAVRDQDWTKCAELAGKKGYSISVFEWAAERLGLALPDEVRKANMDRNKALAKPKEVVEKEEPKKEAHNSNNEALCFVKLLQEMQTTNELLASLLDVVIPKYVADIKDNMNANTDLICERIKDNEKQLEYVARNTRKRGL